jgi:uncharacterized membrane protein YhaH (DUF805 family)
MVPGMVTVIVFLLGVINFAAHQAVLKSGHPMVARLREQAGWFRPSVTLGFEFGALVVALALVTWGSAAWAWVYAIYSLASCWSAWAIVTRRL